jgi:hypothetical protein
MMHFQRPNTLNEIFKWCGILTESSGLFDRMTDTMARYPVTPVTTTDDIGVNQDYWANFLNEELCIQNELVSNGKDFYTFGNCICSFVPPFRRYLVCSKCNSYLYHCINHDNMDDTKFEWMYKGYNFYGKCMNKDCKHHGMMEVKDEYLTGDDFVKNIKVHRWPILNIKIRDLGIAGKKRIYYKIERKYSKGIEKGDRFVVANVPYTFILACKKNQLTPIIELPSELTFHYNHETITEPEWEGLSKPFFFSAWKDLFMSFVLRKAQEMIAADHMIPNRFLFPQTAPGGRDPLSQIDGGSWVNIISTQIKRQQNDPSEFGIVPFPIGYQALGGQGKNMSLREEIELQDRRILTQMGIPPELIYGGMTWSGSNISLRMLENLFLYYIHKHNVFLRVFVNYAARMSGKKAPGTVKLKPFKMADDIQQIQLRSTLGIQGRISETSALAHVDGINLEAEAKQAEDEAIFVQRITAARQLSAAKVNLEVSKTTNEGQVDIQTQTAMRQNQDNTAAQTAITDGFVANTTQGLINKLNAMSYQERQLELKNLQQQDPQKFNEVTTAMMGGASQLPEKRAPRRGPETAQV